MAEGGHSPEPLVPVPLAGAAAAAAAIELDWTGLDWDGLDRTVSLLCHTCSCSCCCSHCFCCACQPPPPAPSGALSALPIPIRRSIARCLEAAVGWPGAARAQIGGVGLDVRTRFAITPRRGSGRARDRQREGAEALRGSGSAEPPPWTGRRGDSAASLTVERSRTVSQSHSAS
eukprot:4933016-Pyramimonas_sp.AAC.1